MEDKLLYLCGITALSVFVILFYLLRKYPYLYYGKPKDEKIITWMENTFGLDPKKAVVYVRTILIFLVSGIIWGAIICYICLNAKDF